MIYVIVKRKRKSGRPEKVQILNPRNPVGRKGKDGSASTDRTSAQGTGAPTKKNATKPPPSARAIKVLLAYLQIDFIDLLEKLSLFI